MMVLGGLNSVRMSDFGVETVFEVTSSGLNSRYSWWHRSRRLRNQTVKLIRGGVIQPSSASVAQIISGSLRFPPDTNP